MRRSFPWLLLGAAAAALVAITLFGGQAQPRSTHRSDSADSDGTLALYRVAAARTPAVTRLRSFDLPPGGLVFVFSPNAEFSRDEATRLRDFVESGGTLVYASEVSDAAIETRFGLARDVRPARDLVAYPPAPLLPGVQEVSGGAAALPFLPTEPDQVPLLRGPLGEVEALVERAGKGRLYAFADPLPLCNGYLSRSDNSRLAAALLDSVAASAPVAFDESHHVAGAAAPPPPSTSPGWAQTPWGIAILWALAAGYIGFALRGRAFGPRVPIAAVQARSTAEYVDAVGSLLRRSGGRAQAAQLLLRATRLSLGRRLGRRPEGQAELASAEAAAALAAGSEAALLHAARELHALAHPEVGR